MKILFSLTAVSAASLAFGQNPIIVDNQGTTPQATIVVPVQMNISAQAGINYPVMSSNISYSNVSYINPVILNAAVQQAYQSRGRDRGNVQHGGGPNVNGAELTFSLDNVAPIANPSLDNIQIAVNDGNKNVQQIAVPDNQLAIQTQSASSGRQKKSGSGISLPSFSKPVPAESSVRVRHHSYHHKSTSVKWQKFIHRLKGKNNGRYRVSDCFHFAS